MVGKEATVNKTGPDIAVGAGLVELNEKLNDRQLTGYSRAVGAYAAAQQSLIGDRIARNDAIQLRLSGSKMIPDNFAEDGAIVDAALQIPAAHSKHRA